jgi:hypothetical protein
MTATVKSASGQAPGVPTSSTSTSTRFSQRAFSGEQASRSAGVGRRCFVTATLRGMQTCASLILESKRHDRPVTGSAAFHPLYLLSRQGAPGIGGQASEKYDWSSWRPSSARYSNPVRRVD